MGAVVGLPVAVAGWEGRWRYAWPRDTAHVAVALQALGDAPGPSGRCTRSRLVVGDHVEARYLPDGGTPDGRHPQSDGMGWVLWSAGRTVDDWLGSSARDDVAALVRRCARLALGQVRASGLPRPSPDYWEVDAPASPSAPPPRSSSVSSTPSSSSPVSAERATSISPTGAVTSPGVSRRR